MSEILTKNMDKNMGTYKFHYNKVAGVILTTNRKGTCLYVNKVGKNITKEYFDNFCKGAFSWLSHNKRPDVD